MVRKIYKTLTFAQIFTGLTLIISLWADSMIIGQYCKGNSLAAYGYVMPIMLLFNAIGQTLAQGNQINCSRLIGHGKHNETNIFFSTGCVTTALLSILSIIILLLFRPKISIFLGTTPDTGVFYLANDYILGLVPGIPFMLLVLVLTPFMQLAGQQKRLILGVSSMIVTDISLNFVAVYGFQRQMIGIGLASSASYLICLLIFISFFFSKECEFRFDIKKWDIQCLIMIIKEGIPTLINVSCTVLLTYTVNRLLGNLGGDNAVAAYSIISNVMNFCYTFSAAIATVTVTATALFDSEKDKKSLIQVLNTMLWIMLFIGIGITFLVSVFAGFISELFVTDDVEVIEIATTGIRILVASFFFSSFTAGFKAFYQGMGYLKYLKAIMIFQNFLGTFILSSILGNFYGVKGVWYGFYLCEILTLLIIYIVSIIKNKSLSVATTNLSLLPLDYGQDSNSKIIIINNYQDNKNTTSEISDFCKNQYLKNAELEQINECVSKLLDKINEANLKHKTEINIRLQNHKDKFIIRLRDNGKNWDSLLITSDINQKYKYSTILGLNNVTVNVEKNN